jgi:hypothetical protein
VHVPKKTHSANDKGQPLLPATGYWDRVARLTALRDARIEEIGRLRSHLRLPSPFLKSAETLLTRQWGRADWSGRTDILHNVGWLLRMAELQTLGVKVEPPKPQKVQRRGGARKRPRHVPSDLGKTGPSRSQRP